MPKNLKKSNNLKRAVFFSLGYGFFLSITAFFGKLTTVNIPDGEIVFFRFLISLIYIAAIIGLQKLNGRNIELATKHFGMHLLRAAASFACQFVLFYSLKYIPLTDANLFFMTNPLFIPIIGAIFFRSKTTLKNWLAIAIGFLGITFILKPGFEIIHSASLVALTSGIFAAISLLGVRELGKSEQPYTIMFYYFSLTFIISSFFAFIGWRTPNFHALILLLGIGISGVLAQECSIRALISAPAKIVAPLMFSSTIFSGLLDWLVWHNAPSLFSWIGIAIVCLGSTLSVIYGIEK